MLLTVYNEPVSDEISSQARRSIHYVLLHQPWLPEASTDDRLNQSWKHERPVQAGVQAVARPELSHQFGCSCSREPRQSRHLTPDFYGSHGVRTVDEFGRRGRLGADGSTDRWRPPTIPHARCRLQWPGRAGWRIRIKLAQASCRPRRPRLAAPCALPRPPVPGMH
jgi:hypothetical protein